MTQPSRSTGGGEARPGRPASNAADGGTRPPGDARSDDDGTGLPGFRSWRAVYVVVFAVFVLVVVALAIFSSAFA